MVARLRLALARILWIYALHLAMNTKYGSLRSRTACVIGDFGSRVAPRDGIPF